MRILQIHNEYLNSGGEDTVVAAERRLLEESGHEVVAYRAQNPRSRWTALSILARSAWNADAARQICEQARTSGAQVAHVHNFWFSLSPSIFSALQEAGLATVFTVHNFRLACVNGLLLRDGKTCTDCVGKTAWRGVMRRCYNGSALASAAVAHMQIRNRQRRTWMNDVDAVIALNSFARDILCQSGVARQRIVIKDNFVPDPGQRTDAPSTSTTLLVVGQLWQVKGIDFLLDAWEQADTGNLRLRILGDGPDRTTLEARQVAGVEFWGQVSSETVTQEMLRARALVFPTRAFEGQPMGMLEAFAAGLPVLCSDHPPLRAIMAGSEPWLVPTSNVSSWVSQLEQLDVDSRVDQAGAANRVRYESRFQPKHALSNLIRVYDQALQTRQEAVAINT